MNSKERNYMVESHRDVYEDEIDLKELFLVLWRNKIKIASVGLIFAVLGLTLGKVKSLKSRTAVAVIEYNYPGIEKGKTPKGDALGLTYNKFKNIFMVKELYKEMPELSKEDISEDNLLSNIHISPVLPDNLEEDEIYFPNKFKYSFKGASSASQDREILKRFLEVHSDYLKKNYMSNILLSEIDYSTIRTYDFSDKISILKTSLNSSLSIIDTLSKELTDFQFKTRLEYFKTNLELLKKINLVRATNLMDDYKITKNPEALLISYKQQLEFLSKDREASLNKISQLEKMIKAYKPEDKEILILGNDGNSKIKTNDENYYTDFLRQLSKERLTLSKINSQIHYLTKKMNQPLNTDTSKENDLENDIRYIVESINKNVDGINTLVVESYNKKYSDVIEILQPVTTHSSGKTMLFAIAALILGLGFGSAYVLVANFIYEEKKKNNQ